MFLFLTPISLAEMLLSCNVHVYPIIHVVLKLCVTFFEGNFVIKIRVCALVKQQQQLLHSNVSNNNGNYRTRDYNSNSCS